MFPDLDFIATARLLEVEAVEGGRPLNEFSVAPASFQNDEELSVLGRAIDDVEETSERKDALRMFIEYARRAYAQRGMVYPFAVSAAGDALDVLPRHRKIAQKAAWFSEISGKGSSTAKEFEEIAFRALHSLTGGWGICVGAKRRMGGNLVRSIDKFRSRLNQLERGAYCPDISPQNSGDAGADGFLILGRAWGGPLVFYQAKNSEFDTVRFPEEFTRMPEVLNSWFGKHYNQFRCVIPVLAQNTVLTLETKEEIFQGSTGIQIFDVVDIMCEHFVSGRSSVRRAKCEIF